MQDIFSNLGYREAGKLVHNAIVQIYTQYKLRKFQLCISSVFNQTD